MKELRSPRRLVQQWHRREKAAIGHLAGSVPNGAPANGRVHSATTSTGLVVEDQIRKAWQPRDGGLPIF